MANTKIPVELSSTPGIVDNSNATAITIDSSENVGIGTGSPSALLDVTVGNAKTANAGVWANLGKTNESSNYQALQCQQVGGSSASERRYEFQTIEQGVANAGSIVFQPSGGNVGIGTSSPAYKLDLSGDMRFTTNSTLFWADTNVYEGRTGNDRYWVTGGSERMRIDSSGNVGIGTSSPLTKTTIATTSGNTALTFQQTNNSTTNFLIGCQYNVGNAFEITPSTAAGGSTFSSPALVVNSSRQVGIGTNSPSSVLHVDAGLNAPLVTIHNTNGASSDSRGLDVETSTTGTTVQRWFNAGSELARVAATGYLMIGTTSTTIGGSSGAGNEGVLLGGSLGNAIAVSNAGCLDLNRKTSNGTILEFRFNGSSVGSISTNANSLPSDRNYKKDIEDLNIGLDLITKLNPVSYNYKIDEDDCPKMFGLIAQDLETSLTEVGVTKNSSWLLQHEPTENEEESDYALDYLKLTPILVKAIQEQQTIIHDLKSRIETLENE